MNLFKSRTWARHLALTSLVVTIGIAAAVADHVRTRSDTEVWTANQAEVVESVVQDVVSGVFNDLEAVAAFIEQSNPSPASFNQFVAQIDGTSNAIGIAYATIIPADSIDQHIADRRSALGDFYDIFRLSDSGMPEPLDKSNRDKFYPVQLFAYGEIIAPLVTDAMASEQLAVGVDGGFVADWRTEIDNAVAAGESTISRFITLDADTFNFDRAFIASVPVEPSNGRDGGLVAALMFEPLLLDNLEKRALEDVQWEVIPIGGSPTRINSDHFAVFPLDLPGTPWSLAVAPTETMLASLVGLPSWLIGLIAAALATLAGLVLWLLLDRRAELSRSAHLRAIADEKDRFLATVSHELRTPLTVVSGVANELSDRPHDFSPEENEDLLAMIVDQTDELSAIVEDLLIAARSDIGKVVINLQEIDLQTQTSRAMETAGVTAPMLGTAGIAIGDDQRVRQILRNLLTNARRYGGPTVQIEFSQQGGWSEITVADDGSGIPEDKRAVVFEAYESAHQMDRAVKSVGLGLFISRGLATAMGGNLGYAYEAGWSRFRLRLPSADLQPRRHTGHPVAAASNTTG